MRKLTPWLAAAVVASITAVGAAAGGPGSSYRYIGWVETLGVNGSPSFPTRDEYVFNGFRLGFVDEQAHKPTPYQVCVTRAGRSVRCWAGRAWPVNRIRVTNYDASLPVGRYVAKWTVSGKLVATWRFRLHGEDA